MKQCFTILSIILKGSQNNLKHNLRKEQKLIPHLNILKLAEYYVTYGPKCVFINLYLTTRLSIVTNESQYKYRCFKCYKGHIIFLVFSQCYLQQKPYFVFNTING